MKTPTALLLLVALQTCYAPPVTQNKEQDKNEQSSDGLEDYMEYHRYLREVVSALESDPEFRQKLEKATEDDIRSGKIAGELEFVSHNVRTRLDEIKRTELQRLRKSMDKIRQFEENNDLSDPVHHHLDQENPHTFEIEDLKKLIAKTTEDLAEADRKRREEFKQYEMQKEIEKLKKLNSTTGEEHEKLEKMYKEQEEKHKKHAPLHEPGHKKQLEEVWEEQDHMQQEFDPRTFFTLHDLDGNNLWDQDEVKALFVKELDKMYAAGAPEDDMRERAEEMERMRETVFREVDTNKDGFIDFHEFMAQTKRNEFQQDHGWQGLDEQRPYTDEELQAYMRAQQMQYQYPQGYQPGYHPGQVPPQAYQVPPGYQVPQGYHPNQVPQQGYQQVHPGQQVPPAAGYHPGQVPQGNYHPGQIQQQQQNQAQYYPAQGQQVPQQPQQQIPQPNIPKQQGLPELNTNEVYLSQPNNIPQQGRAQNNQQLQQQPNKVPQQATGQVNQQFEQQQQNIPQHGTGQVNPQFQQNIPQQGTGQVNPQFQQQNVPQQGGAHANQQFQPVPNQQQYVQSQQLPPQVSAQPTVNQNAQPGNVNVQQNQQIPNVKMT